MKPLIFLILAVSAGSSAFAQDTPTYGTPDCKVVKVVPAPLNGAVQWNGKCKDGFANGKGALVWRGEDGKTRRLQGYFEKGDILGEGKLRIADELTYIGSLRNGFPDGEGYLKFADGLQYEGGIRMMQREGKGTEIYTNGNVYQGQFSNNQPHGQGRLSFVLGGSIEGEFRDGKPVGKVKLTYAGSGRTAEVDMASGVLRKTEPSPAPAANAGFQEREAEPRLGTLMRRVQTTTPVPSNVGWDKLTPEQRDQVRSQYPALEEGDDPPYPENGPAPIYKVIRAAGGRYGDNSVLRMNVLVGADGTAKQVVKLGDFDAYATNYVAAAAMAQHYRPAICHGKPCEMMYPLNINFVLVME